MNLADDLVTVVGIMPPGFDFPSPAVDLWVPMANRLRGRSRSAHYLDVIGRLGPAATLAGATDVLRTIAARLERISCDQSRLGRDGCSAARECDG